MDLNASSDILRAARGPVPVCRLCACRIDDYDLHYVECHERQLERERLCFSGR